jgi:uncharacterized RmlC-like cupin family protein
MWGMWGITYGAGASAEMVGARYVCMYVLPIPLGVGAKRTTTKASKQLRTFLKGNALFMMAHSLRTE